MKVVAAPLPSVDPAGALPEIGLVLLADTLNVAGQVGLDCGRQHRHPILVALAVADYELVHLEVDIF